MAKFQYKGSEPGSSSNDPASPALPIKRRKHRQRRPSRRKVSRAKWEAIRLTFEKEAKDDVYLPGTWNVEDYNRFCRLLCETQRRKAETLRIYKPLPVAQGLHACMAHEVSAYGANRGGKTQACAVEVAWAATGQHPIEGKYLKENLRICVVVEREDDLGLIYDYLFAPGMFRVFQHPETLEWHTVIPSNAEHQKFRELWQKSEPLIPKRMMKGKPAWYNKGKKAVRLVRLYNGTEIEFFSGQAITPPKGRKYHLIWLDEEIVQADIWLEELRPRLIDYNGRLLWSATAQMATMAWREMYFRSLEPDNRDKPLAQQVVMFHFDALDNYYLDEEGREAYREKYKDNPLVWRTRVEGKPAYDELLVLPEYRPDLHRKKPFPIRWDDSLYMLVDPGIEVAGILWILCPSPAKPNETFKKLSNGGMGFEEFVRRRAHPTLFAIKECYIRSANNLLVGQEARRVLADLGGHQVQDMTVDIHGGRGKYPSEGNRPIMDIYADRFEQFGIKAVVPGWKWADSDVVTGIEKVKQYLLPHPVDQVPSLYVSTECQWLHHELVVWKKKFVAGGKYMTGYEKPNHHLIDLCRYACMRGLQWVTPPDRFYKESTLTTTKGRQMMRQILQGKVFTRFGS